MISSRVAGLLMVSTFALAACGKSPQGADAGADADLIITGGPILTMEGAAPTTATMASMLSRPSQPPALPSASRVAAPACST